MPYTPLYEIHKKLGAKFMEFGGFEMPLQYTGIIDEHLTVRNKAGVFDVSHMGEIFIEGKDAESFCDWLTPNRVSSLTPGQVHYNFLLNEHGGIIDDLIIYRLSKESFMFCVNASNIQKDYLWIREHRRGNADVINKSAGISMISVQGPFSDIIMNAVFPSIDKLKRFTFQNRNFNDTEVYISKTGYTGENGYECFADKNAIVNLWNAVMDSGRAYGIKPIGLGARDTLRTEMGYPLYGLELNEAITPFSANLGWVVKMDKQSFIGRSALLSAQDNMSKRLVGIIVKDKSIPRHQNPVLLKNKAVGEITSGTYSPSLSRGIAMAYIDSSVKADEIDVNIRGSIHTGLIVQLPFIKK